MLFSLFSLEENLITGQNPKLHTTRRKKANPVTLRSY